MKTKYLSEVTNIKSGNSAPQGEEPFVNGKYNFYRTYDVGQIKQGEIFESRDKVNKETYSNLKIFPVNTILFPKSGASTFNNNRVIIKKEGAIASHLAGIKANSEFLNDYYLYYFLLTIDAKNLVQDSAYPSVNLKQISQIEIPVPSLQEQEKIVERLDKVFNNVDLNLKNTEHTDFEIDKLFTSIIHEIFLEKEVRLGNLIELNYGKDLDKKERGDKYKIPLYGSNGIMDFASKPLYDGKSVIVGRKGSVGELQYVEVPFWVIDVGFYVTLTNKDHLMRYYYYLLKSLNLQNLSTGVKPGLNRNKVYEILVPKHDLNQQKKIVDKLDKLFLLKHQMQNLSIKKTASNTLLKRSILNKEFSYE